jgi:hypothetical protein
VDSGAAPTLRLARPRAISNPRKKEMSAMKRYKTSPKGKRPPFEFELEDDEGVVTKFVCQGAAQMLDLMEFATLSQLGVTDPRAAKAIADLFESTMGPLVYQDFRAYNRQHGTDPEVTMQILMDMVEYTLNGRPLDGSSPSSDGRGNIGGTSMDGSPHVLSAEEIDRWRKGLPAEVPAGQLQTASMADLARGGTPTMQTVKVDALRASGTR